MAGAPLVCDDGNACNGAETCDPGLGCQAGTPLDCDDGNACTADSCDAVTGCAHDPIQGCGPPVPIVPLWGRLLVVLMLSAAAGLLVGGRRRADL